MERDHVGAGEKLIEPDVLDHVCERGLGVGVAGDHARAEADEPADDGLADAPGAHDAHGAGAERAADLSPELEVLVGGRGVHKLGLAQRHEDEHHGVVGHAVGRVGGVGHADAEVTRRAEVDVVVADGARGDAADAHGRVALEQLGRHRVRDDGQRVVTAGQLGVLERGVFARPAVLEAVLGGLGVEKRELVVLAQGISEQLHETGPSGAGCSHHCSAEGLYRASLIAAMTMMIPMTIITAVV